MRLSPRLLALIPLAVGINLALGKFVSAMSLPVYLDTVGTVQQAEYDHGKNCRADGCIGNL